MRRYAIKALTPLTKQILELDILTPILCCCQFKTMPLQITKLDMIKTQEVISRFFYRQTPEALLFDIARVLYINDDYHVELARVDEDIELTKEFIYTHRRILLHDLLMFCNEPPAKPLLLPEVIQDCLVLTRTERYHELL
jgi:hypothetical protein